MAKMQVFKLQAFHIANSLNPASATPLLYNVHTCCNKKWTRAPEGSNTGKIHLHSMRLLVLMAVRRQNIFKAKPRRMLSISLHFIRLETKHCITKDAEPEALQHTGLQRHREETWLRRSSKGGHKQALGCERVFKGNTL